MRFKKGSKVEVLSKREEPSGSWFYAEILSANGRYYKVKYGHCSPDGGQVIEKVENKAVRPLPPTVVGLRSWMPGDIAEVLENHSWKPARMMRAVDGGSYYVVIMLVGSSKEIKLHRTNIRRRQSWKGNRWVLIDEEPEDLNEGKAVVLAKRQKFDLQTVQPCLELRNSKDDRHIYAQYEKCAVQPYQISLRGLKKRPHFSSTGVEINTRPGARRKLGAVKKGRKHQRLLVAPSSELPGKVDAFGSSRINFGDKHMDASINNKTGFPEWGMNWDNSNEDVHFFLGSLEHDDSIISSSVGSCCPSGLNGSRGHPKSNHTEDMDIHFGYDEASSGSGIEPSKPGKDGGTAEIHQLELDAYHSLMVALYASGPLSWEREALLTNLRLSLHITNDEHLLELRNLNKYEK